jgi:hypothetical protein
MSVITARVHTFTRRSAYSYLSRVGQECPLYTLLLQWLCKIVETFLRILTYLNFFPNECNMYKFSLTSTACWLNRTNSTRLSPTYFCVCVCAHACVRACLCAMVRERGVVGVRPCVLIYLASNARFIVMCGLFGSIVLFDVISKTAKFSKGRF